MYDDEDLTTRLAANLDLYFQQLVLTYQQRLYSVMLRQCGSTLDAEEIVQEAFLRAYCALRNYAPEKIRAMHIRPWLDRIALNVFYNRVRSPVLECTSFDGTEEHPAFEVMDRGPLPEEEIGRREQRRELEQQVTALPEQYQTVIELYYFQECTYQEIANRLNQPLGTVKARIHRAISLLRKTHTSQQKVHVGEADGKR